jgi:dynein intermediate chain
MNDALLASYGQNEEGGIHDHVGVILVWSMELRNRPEFYCFCQSPITSAMFYPFSNSIVLGSLYNGQIALWDLRAKTSPIQRTTLSNESHSFPIYSLAVVGSQNAHNIVSVSNDGKVCSWSMSQFTTPTKSYMLNY